MDTQPIDPAEFERSEIRDGDLVKAANTRLEAIAKMVRPGGAGGKPHLYSIALHFYGKMNALTFTGDFEIVTQKTGDGMTKELATKLLPEIRDRVFQALGAEAQRLSPKTVEESKDLGDHNAH